jgi:hypothetical protein
MMRRLHNKICDECMTNAIDEKQNYWGSGLCLSSGILKTRKRDSKLDLFRKI